MGWDGERYGYSAIDSTGKDTDAARAFLKKLGPPPQPQDFECSDCCNKFRVWNEHMLIWDVPKFCPFCGYDAKVDGWANV